MSRMKVVVTDTVFDSVEPEQRVLSDVADVILAPASDTETLRGVLADADGVLNCYARLDADLVRGLKRCRIIARYGIGLDTIPIEAATEAGIVVTNVPDYCIEEVADHTLALLLNLARGVAVGQSVTREGGWGLKAWPPLRRLRGQTLSLLGFGRIARTVAARARGFGMRILAYDPYVPDTAMAAIGAEAATFANAARQADFLSLHMPLSEQTHHLIDAAVLAQMKPTAYLLNTSRGGLVDTDALVAALTAGRLAGAGVDVLEQEPPPSDHPLRRMPNVLLTPHAAFYSKEALAELEVRAAEEVGRVLRGEAPRSPANAAALARRG
ncbi:MAG: C-terminal binding protein [Anaerolineae bacterium]